MDLNQIRALAGLPYKKQEPVAPQAALAIQESKLPEARVIRDDTALQEAASGGKKQGAINMILAMLEWGEGGKLTHAQVSKVLGLAYDAGREDGAKA